MGRITFDLEDKLETRIRKYIQRTTDPNELYGALSRFLTNAVKSEIDRLEKEAP